MIVYNYRKMLYHRPFKLINLHLIFIIVIYLYNCKHVASNQELDMDAPVPDYDYIARLEKELRKLEIYMGVDNVVLPILQEYTYYMNSVDAWKGIKEALPLLIFYANQNNKGPTNGIQPSDDAYEYGNRTTENLRGRDDLELLDYDIEEVYRQRGNVASAIRKFRIDKAMRCCVLPNINGNMHSYWINVMYCIRYYPGVYIYSEDPNDCLKGKPDKLPAAYLQYEYKNQPKTVPLENPIKKGKDGEGVRKLSGGSNNDITNATHNSTISINVTVSAANVSDIISIIRTHCRVEKGSVLKLPKLELCQHVDSTILQCETFTGNTMDFGDNHPYPPCPNINKLFHFIYTRKITWYLAKINYVVIFLSGCLFCHPKVRKRLISLTWWQRRYFILYGVLNLAWLLWRLQETLHWETNWQNKLPYICLFFESLNYMLESLSLYLFASISYERYQVVAHPILSLVRKHIIKSKTFAICTGCVMGMVISVLNFITLFRFRDTYTRKTCTVVDASEEDLSFGIALKSVKLFLIYLLPCLIMVSTNISFVYTVHKRFKNPSKFESQNMSSTPLTKTCFTLGFILISSILMFSCVTKPLFELYLNVLLHFEGESLYIFTIDNVIQGIIWNISTVGFGLNTIIAICFTPILK